MITLEQFKRTFTHCKSNLSTFATMPKNKEDYTRKLYLMYKWGRKNKEDEVLRRIENLITNGKKEVVNYE